jgi:hypothetical protein
MRDAAHLARGTSLTKIVAGDDVTVDRHAAWRWRHRLLSALKPAKPERLGGVVEVDERFFLRSFKRHRGRKRGARPENRPPRYRRSGAFLPGLSHRQVPVLTAIDRDGRHLDALMERRSDDQVVGKLGEAIEPDSVLCADDFSAYAKLAEDAGADRRVFSPPKDDWLSDESCAEAQGRARPRAGHTNGHRG